MLNPLRLGAATNDLSGLLQKGLFEEEANRNLDAAVQAYQSLVTAFDQDRKLAATAVFRLGECYRKLGKTNEAVLQYERIVREFADETTLITLSRQNLTGLSFASAFGKDTRGSGFTERPQAATPSSRPDLAEEARLLDAQLAGIDKLKDDPEQQARAVLALFPDDGLKTMLVQLQKLRNQEAEWRERGGTNLGPANIFFAIGPTADQQKDSYHVTMPGRPILLEAQKEVKDQHLLISQRVEFILGLQKARLQVLQAAAGSTASPTMTQAARQEQKRLLEQEIKLLEQDLAEAKKRAEMGASPQADVRNKEREVLQLRRQVAALDANANEGAAGAGGSAKTQADLLATQLASLEKLKNDPEKQARAVLALFPDDLLSAMLMNLPKLREQEAVFSTNAQPKLDGFRMAISGEKELLDMNPKPPGLPEAQAEVKKQLVHLTRRTEYILGLQTLRLQGLQAAVDASSAKLPSKSAAIVVDDEETEIRRLQAMIQNSPDLKDAPAGEDKLTPLCRSASKGQLRVAQFLLDKGASLEQRASGRTPLLHAAANGHKAMVELLLAHGAEVNARDTTVRVYRGPGDRVIDERTGLHMAAEKGFLAVAEALAAGNADVNARNSDQATPLHLALAKGYAELAKVLISKGAEVDAQDGNGGTALSCAAERGDLDSVTVLLAAKADPNAGKRDLPLACAVKLGDVSLVELLLHTGADPNREAPISSPIVVDGRKYDAGVRSPLQHAVALGNAAMVKLLLRFKGDPDSKAAQKSLSVVVVATGNPEILKAFLDAGADVNQQDSKTGDTPLHIATLRRNGESVRLLLDHKADPNLRNNDGQTPLDLAKAMMRMRQGEGAGNPGMLTPVMSAPGYPSVPTASPADLEALFRQHGAKASSESPEPAKTPEKP